MTDTKKHSLLHGLHRRRRLIISLVVVSLLIFVLIPQTDTLWHSLEIVRQASLPLAGLALCLAFLTYALNTEIYNLLLKRAIPLRTLFLVQLSTALTARIAPIGVGTMGFNAYFLKRQGHSLSDALAVVGINNGMGIVGHLAMAAIIATTAPLPDSANFSLTWSALYWVALAVAAITLVLTFADRWRKAIITSLRSFGAAIASYRHRRKRLLLAFVTAVGLSLVYVMTLLACTQALGIFLPFNEVFLIYTFSLFTGALTATPGGLVGVEAGLVTAFVAYGVESQTALAIALLYRLITYWIPLLPGFIAFRIVQHRYL